MEGDEVNQAIAQAAAPAAAKRQRGPGRPPKERPELIQADVIGIAPAPVNPTDFVEFVYYEPSNFKKILALCKAYEASEIDLAFSKTGLTIRAVDHLKKSSIYVTIDGSLLNLYYCRDGEPIIVRVKRTELESIVSNLDKHKYKIQFILKENYRSKIYVIVSDIQYDEDSTYIINTLHTTTQGKFDDNDERYPVKFQLDSKHIKNKINQIQKFSNFLTIRKPSYDELQFTFDGAQRVNYSGRYKNSAKINLRSTLDPDDIFAVTVSIEGIKPFTNTSIGDVVHIAADKDARFSMTSYLDPKPMGKYVICVKVFTDIIGKKEE